jgi:hypothetical protein
VFALAEGTDEDRPGWAAGVRHQQRRHRLAAMTADDTQPEVTGPDPAWVAEQVAKFTPEERRRATELVLRLAREHRE